MTQAKIIKDSLIPTNSGLYKRVTTLEFYYWRGIHAEFMTHRRFSRNASSSRAISVDRMIADHCGFTPDNWRKATKGMQPSGIFDFDKALLLDDVWHAARDNAIQYAKHLWSRGVAKEQVNRLLEPFMFIKVLVTSTEWDNFFSLRNHPDAQYEIQKLAKEMLEAINNSVPQKRYHHLPYIDDFELAESDTKERFYKASVARCARVSYANHDGSMADIKKDISLFDKLITSRPMHASPAEHQVMSWNFYYDSAMKKKFPLLSISKLNGNLSPGLIQYRKLLENI